MNKKMFLIGGMAAVLTCTPCAAQQGKYQLTGVQRSRILIDARYDKAKDPKAVEFLAPYKHVVDSIMSPVVAQSDHYMVAHRPESDLSNLLADILVWAAKGYNEKVDFAVYNMGGIRAALPKGNVTVGDVNDIAPFENKICFLTLSGEKVLELFRQIAHTGGEGVSKGVLLGLTKHNTLQYASLHGKQIDPKAKYRIATIDYLAEGNDKLEAFKAKTDFNAPQDASNNSRYIILNYFKAMTAEGKAINSKTEGRIAYSGNEENRPAVMAM
ncbi:5'-nucleotidase C-terminal domain-containing protein [Prevotella falsenii]|uniref:5'-nucleotidase C-terminal domain-containing protein n=1 Tax=Prevotella falsenii TaxID=515414 RepID=UPI00046A15E2|nr:5'-nucleotidase [Prevotella falsenii]